MFNYWPELKKHNIVKVTRAFGKTKLYTLNTESPIARKLQNTVRSFNLFGIASSSVKNKTARMTNIMLSKIKPTEYPKLNSI